MTCRVCNGFNPRQPTPSTPPPPHFPAIVSTPSRALPTTKTFPVWARGVCNPVCTGSGEHDPCASRGRSVTRGPAVPTGGSQGRPRRKRACSRRTGELPAGRCVLAARTARCVRRETRRPCTPPRRAVRRSPRTWPVSPGPRVCQRWRSPVGPRLGRGWPQAAKAVKGAGGMSGGRGGARRTVRARRRGVRLAVKLVSPVHSFGGVDPAPRAHPGTHVAPAPEPRRAPQDDACLPSCAAFATLHA